MRRVLILAGSSLLLAGCSSTVYVDDFGTDGNCYQWEVTEHVLGLFTEVEPVFIYSSSRPCQ